jgi:hypothetical protein
MKKYVQSLGLNKERTEVYIVRKLSKELAMSSAALNISSKERNGRVTMLPQHYFYQKLQTSWQTSLPDQPYIY